MKKFKILLVVATIILGALYSCSDDKSVETKPDVEQSIALRSLLNYIKKEKNITGRISQTNISQSNTSVFDFVYPITLSYNNGTTITVDSFEDLIDVLTNENQTLYINGIAFPFQVILTADGSTVTINSEEEFFNLIDTLNIETIADYTFSSLCYDFVYPFSMVDQNNSTIVISNQNDLISLFSNPNADNLLLDFVYPFSVIYNNETIVINNEYEFFTLNNDCAQTSCNCPTIYQPVCVNTPNGIEEFPNACYAECAGYTTSDFVNCSGTGGTSIWFNYGSCFTIAFPVQVQMGGSTMTVNNSNQLLYAIFPSANNASLVFPVNVTITATNAQFTFQDQATMDTTLNNICN